MALRLLLMKHLVVVIDGCSISILSLFHQSVSRLRDDRLELLDLLVTCLGPQRHEFVIDGGTLALEAAPIGVRSVLRVGSVQLVLGIAGPFFLLVVVKGRGPVVSTIIALMVSALPVVRNVLIGLVVQVLASLRLDGSGFLRLVSVVGNICHLFERRLLGFTYVRARLEVGTHPFIGVLNCGVQLA